MGGGGGTRAGHARGEVRGEIEGEGEGEGEGDSTIPYTTIIYTIPIPYYDGAHTYYTYTTYSSTLTIIPYTIIILLLRHAPKPKPKRPPELLDQRAWAPAGEGLDAAA